MKKIILIVCLVFFNFYLFAQEKIEYKSARNDGIAIKDWNKTATIILGNEGIISNAVLLNNTNGDYDNSNSYINVEQNGNRYYVYETTKKEGDSKLWKIIECNDKSLSIKNANGIEIGVCLIMEKSIKYKASNGRIEFFIEINDKYVISGNDYEDEYSEIYFVYKNDSLIGISKSYNDIDDILEFTKTSRNDFVYETINEGGRRCTYIYTNLKQKTMLQNAINYSILVPLHKYFQIVPFLIGKY
jgi:hypothetical protein